MANLSYLQTKIIHCVRYNNSITFEQIVAKTETKGKTEFTEQDFRDAIPGCIEAGALYENDVDGVKTYTVMNTGAEE